MLHVSFILILENIKKNKAHCSLSLASHIEVIFAYIFSMFKVNINNEKYKHCTSRKTLNGHDFNKLEFTHPVGASTQVTAFLIKIVFEKNIFEILIYACVSLLLATVAVVYFSSK